LKPCVQRTPAKANKTHNGDGGIQCCVVACIKISQKPIQQTTWYYIPDNSNLQT